MIPSHIKSMEEWEEYIKQNPLDENQKQILVNLKGWLKQRIEHQAKAEAEADAKCD